MLVRGGVTELRAMLTWRGVAPESEMTPKVACQGRMGGTKEIERRWTLLVSSKTPH